MTARSRRAGLIAVTLGLLGAMAACAPGGGTRGSPGASAPVTPDLAAGDSPAPAPVELQVAAAASLRTVLETAIAAYASANPGVSFALSTDSSAALRTKIEQGAPTDLFLSADTANPQALVDAGLAGGPVTVFAGNRLTVIVPADNPVAIRTPADLARGGVKVIAAGDEVPLTRYAAAMVGNLAGLPGYPAGFADAVAANTVSREDNASAVVTKIALGEGDAAIVYRTDALANPDVVSVDVPAEANVVATYGAVVPRDAASASEAVAFLAWLGGPEGQAILAGAGFEPGG